MLSKNTYKPLKEELKKKNIPISHTKIKNDSSLTLKSTNVKEYIKRSNMNPILKFVYLNFSK